MYHDVIDSPAGCQDSDIALYSGQRLTPSLSLDLNAPRWLSHRFVNWVKWPRLGASALSAEMLMPTYNGPENAHPASLGVTGIGRGLCSNGLQLTLRGYEKNWRCETGILSLIKYSYHYNRSLCHKPGRPGWLAPLLWEFYADGLWATTHGNR